MAQLMFDRKLEMIAQQVVRAKITVEEAKEDLEAACEKFRAAVPEGEKYVTKDGEVVTHARSSVRKAPDVEACRSFLKGKLLRIWRAVRVDAIDSKKLVAYIETGELDYAVLVENGCLVETPIKSSVRVNFPAIKPTAASPSASPNRGKVA